MNLIRDNKRKIIITLLVILEIIFLFLVYKTFPIRETLLDDVKLQNDKISNKGFALMLEQSDGTYKESDSNGWPTNMKFNSELSGCIDVDGNIIQDALSFDSTNNLLNISIGETAHCYVYFDISNTLDLLCNVGDNLGSCITNNVNQLDDLWKSTLEGDGYRYVGTNPNNYICFGTTDIEVCRTEYTNYMYRIIGVFEDESGNQHLKLIKNDPLGKYAWHNDVSSDTDWNKSDLYNSLQVSYSLPSSLYDTQDNMWLSRISTWNYTMTDTQNYYINNDVSFYLGISSYKVYLHELNRGTNQYAVGTHKNFSGKISLMYLSDYLLSLGYEALNYTRETDSDKLTKGWLNLMNNNNYKTTEWTMTRSSSDTSNAAVFAQVPLDISMGEAEVDGSLYVRPVFYLQTGELYNGGAGTFDDPIMLSEKPLLTDDIISNAKSEDLWDSTLEGDGYRYVGTNPDNYICFGTNSKSECLNNTSDYMYRVIGVFEDESGNRHAKLIKKEAYFDTAYEWTSSSSSEITWENSELYNQIVTHYYAPGADTTWTDKISSWNYVLANTRTNTNSGLDYYNATAQQIYLNELNKSGNTNKNGTYTTYSGDIGLMYVSDYMLSLGSSALNYTSSSNATELAKGWMFIGNNDTNAPSNDEWTMTRYGSLDGRYAAWYLYRNGSTNVYYVDNTASVRPVFYLDSGIRLLGGTGSATDPFIIE